MKATVRQSHFLDTEHVPFTSSLVLSICLHSALVLWIIGSAWFLQPYRLASHTVFLGGDSPFAIDQIPGEGGAGSGTRQARKEAETASPSASAEASAEPSVEKFAPPVDRPVPPPPKPAAEKPLEALPPKPVVEKAVPPPPKPVVERPAPPTPAPKPVVEKALPAPPKPPPEAMTLAQKETKPTAPPAPPDPTATEVQQAVAKLRERQAQHEAREARTAAEVQQSVAQLRQRQAEQQRVEQAAQQRVAGLRAEQAEQQAAQQRIAALRARTSSAGSEEGSGSAGSGTVGTGRGLPGGGRGTGTAGAGGIGTGGLSGIRLRSYQAQVQEKVRNAWSVPPQSRGLQAIVFLTIDRAGNVEQFRFVQRSGNAQFDESLQRAIKHAEPLPPLPEDYAGRSLEAELRFRPSD